MCGLDWVVAISGMPLQGIRVMETLRLAMRTEDEYKNQTLVPPLL
jgi:hypothetical protein